MTEQRLASLETRLADLGAAVAFPATPPIAALVAERLREQRLGTGLRRPFTRGLALALAATLILVGIAAAVGIALGGLRLTFGPPPSPLPSFAVGPGLGNPTALADARSGVTFTLRVPSVPDLGQPDLVYLAKPPAGGAVTLLYGPRKGFPANSTTGIGLVITQFRADIQSELFEKLLDSGVSVSATRVHGLAAWWIAGGEHFFFYRDANGRVVDTTLRLAGDTLIWEEGRVTHRVEGAPSLAAALLVADSLR
jgi:hypothetical protein